MIPQTKIVEAFSKTLHAKSYNSFRSGVRFAESEMGQIAQEFAEWCSNNGYTFYKSLGVWHERSGMDEGYTTSELFAKFME